MDQQSEQLQQWMRQKLEQVVHITQKQKETKEHVTAIAGDLESVEINMHEPLSAVKEWQKLQKQKLCEKELQELSASLKLKQTSEAIVKQKNKKPDWKKQCGLLGVQTERPPKTGMPKAADWPNDTAAARK